MEGHPEGFRKGFREIISLLVGVGIGAGIENQDEAVLVFGGTDADPETGRICRFKGQVNTTLSTRDS